MFSYWWGDWRKLTIYNAVSWCQPASWERHQQKKAKKI